MKIAISIPDDLHAAADALAERTHRSRSSVYAEAVREYLARHSDDEVTAAMNAIVDALGTPDLDVVEAASREVFRSTTW